MNINNKERNFLLQDVAIIFLSILIAFILAETGIIMRILTSTKGFELIGSFIAGMFFTSIFTTAPAIAALGEIARTNSIGLVVLFGGAGAVIGDLIIFRFFRNKLSDHLVELVKHQGMGKRVKALFRLRLFRWFTVLLGGLVIASPLPDELGLMMLGFSKIKNPIFIPVSFLFNSLGILIISLIATAIK